MQISLKWVNELVNLENTDLDNLINKLTLGGFEVEEILEVEIDNKKTLTLDISATANRSDSLSIQGLSLEIAALLDQAPKICEYSTTNFVWGEHVQNFMTSALLTKECSGFIALTVKNLTNLTSPIWVKQKLLTSGITPENNLVDFKNFILLESGYPFEFYDLEKIYSKLGASQFSLNIISAKDFGNFCASNKITYNLKESILMLRANELPLSLAGIISSDEVTYSNKTNSLLIEGSIFKAAKIRQESRILGLRTDRSSRYEKALKNTDLLKTFYRLICLLRLQNPKLSCKLHTIGQPKKENLKKIVLKYENIKQVLGPITKTREKQGSYIPTETITDSLRRLQFQVNYRSDNELWEVVVPSYRNDDILQEIDLIEEIGRIYGFNKFVTRLPQIKKIGREDLHYQTRKKLTSCLINLGLNELIQYSLVDDQPDIDLLNKIPLINPLVKDYSKLRRSLLPNLLKVIQDNLKNGNSVLEGFEYGHVFSGNSSNDLTEKEYISGVFGGTKQKLSWSDSSNVFEFNWFEAKGRIEQLLQKLTLTTYWKPYNPVNETALLHPYCTAKVYLSNRAKLGLFGKINPIVAKRLGIPLDLYFFEFDFELIQNQIQKNKVTIHKDYPVYPKIIKNLSFIIGKTISFQNVQELLYLNSSKFLREVNLLDQYQGKSIPKHHKSLCLQLIFQSENKTLQNKDIENILQNLTVILQRKFNIIIRN